MRVLVCHNRYRSSLPSGEDAVAERETAWLRDMPDLAVDTWTLASDDLLRAGWLAWLRAGWALPGATARRCAFAAELRRRRPDLVHAHNLWPLFTFDLVAAARDVGVPVVLTLHNHRLIASNGRRVVGGRLLAPRDAAERIEQQRLGACHGRFAELVYRRMLRSVWGAGLPQTALASVICLSRFQQKLAVAAGLPAARLVVKPNACPDPGAAGAGAGGYALFVGRLDRSKGIDALAAAWPATGLPPLRVVGDGPLVGALAGRAGVELLGRRAPGEVAALMADARFLVMGSTWHETFGLVLIEALACGTPCLVPHLGAMPEIVRDGACGRVFRPDDPAHLVEQARRLWDEAATLRPACRQAYLDAYTPAHAQAALRRIYDAVLASRPI